MPVLQHTLVTLYFDQSHISFQSNVLSLLICKLHHLFFFCICYQFPEPKHNLTENCFESGNFGGSNIDQILDLKDAVSCQKECLKHPECKFWSYVTRNDGSKRCWLKPANANEFSKTQSHAIRGPRLCPGTLLN